MLFQLKKALNLLTPPVVMAYRAYGTRSEVHIRGHVLDDRMLYEAQRHDRRRKNLKAMLSRYMSSSIPHVRVQVNFCGRRYILKTDEHGHFHKKLTFDPPLQETGWIPIHYRVVDDIEPEQPNPEKTGEVYVWNNNSDFGVVSDVDDTILISHATEDLKKLRLILTKNAKTRLPFTGVASFYHALRTGRGENSENPIFYVSSSEWNLYDFLVDFCQARSIPKGPFLLQNLKRNLWELLWSGGGSHHHKAEKIKHLLDVFPDLKFILIGDSGQRDPELYTDVAEAYPGRILAIYIRDVAGRKGREKVEECA
ncbi:MAG: phosphatase domain-containing protein, partial [Saprospiraceae bacterium]|nr:phosphatase domain-containing protein [Saprospiraceae bacterium]